MQTAQNNHDPSTLDPETLLREEQAARFLGVSIRALANWRAKGIGPTVIRLSHRCVRYRRKDLIAFVEGHVPKDAA